MDHVVELQDEGEAERDDLSLVFPALHGRPHPHPYHYEECEEAHHGSISYLLVVARHHGQPKEKLKGKLHRFEVIVLRAECTVKDAESGKEEREISKGRERESRD